MDDFQRILSYTRRAVEDYQMIDDGDSVAVGVSGGKDSVALLRALAALREFLPERFELHAITLDMGFAGADFSPIDELCRELSVPYHIIKTQIAEIIFEVRHEANPCALCAKMRRGALHDETKAIGCNKLALGHHHDDVVETFMLNLLHGGRLGTFQPVTYLSRKDITMIRPFIYAEEHEIRHFVEEYSLPVIKSPCPEDGATEREEMKRLLSSLECDYHGIRGRIFGAVERAGIDGWHVNKKGKRRQGKRTEVGVVNNACVNTDSVNNACVNTDSENTGGDEIIGGDTKIVTNK